FGEPLLIGICFLITATLLRMSEKPGLIVRPAAEKELPPTPLEKITLRETLIIGVSQMFAILPGLSRSGTTISAGILSGVNREAAGTFSFLLAIPAIGGAAFLELLSLVRHGVPQGSEDASIPQMAVGLLLSAAVSYGALSWLTTLIKRGKLSYFSYYLYFAGVAVILWRLAVAVKG
ncbi:undecaprenyl-diphosphate phosphatase, partial [uncultured Victivallis sp.]